MATKGRPSKFKGLNSPTVRKLVQCFENDLTVEESCAQARIAKSTYYEWAEKHGDFSDEMERAQTYPLTIAKKNVMQAIKAGNVQLSFKMLERRDHRYRDCHDHHENKPSDFIDWRKKLLSEDKEKEIDDAIDKMGL